MQYQEDRQRTERLLADGDYLARELASIRLALGEVATRDYVRSELRDLVEDLAARMDAIEAQRRETGDDRPA